MNVQLLSTTDNPVGVIYAAIRTCKSADNPETIMEDTEFLDEAVKIKLIKACHKAGHDSVLEHMSMTFAVSGVSRALLAQYTRHRHLSFSVQSQRYVKMGDARFIIPESYKDKYFKGILDGGDPVSEGARELVNECRAMYKSMIESGIKPEDARFILPGGMACNFVTSMNLRSFLELYEKRVKVKGAQWEIRNMVELMAEKLAEKEPWIRELLDIK